MVGVGGNSTEQMLLLWLDGKMSSLRMESTFQRQKSEFFLSPLLQWLDIIKELLFCSEHSLMQIENDSSWLFK